MLRLKNRGVLAVEGAEAHAFLEGLSSNHIQLDAPTYTALLTPQGRYLFDFFVIPQPQGFYLDVVQERLAALHTALQRYRLRRPVVVADVSPTWQVCVGFDAAPHHAFADPRHPSMGWRALLPASQSVVETLSLAAYHTARIQAVVPETGIDLIVEETLPLEANFDRLNAISFQKGCYIGQEVNARMYHRQSVKKRLVCIKGMADFSSADLSISAADGTQIGQRFSAQGRYALALLPVDFKAESLLCGAVAAHIC